MKQQEVFKKIGGILKELSDQYEYLKTVDGQLNDLELELFMANSHFLSDHVIILGKLNAQLTPVKQPEPKPETAEQKIAEEPQTINPEPVKVEEPRYFEPLVQPAASLADNEAKISEEQPVPHIDLGSGDNDDSYSYMREEPETIRHELILDEADWGEEDEQYENELAEQPVEKAPDVVPASKKAIDSDTDTKPVFERATKDKAKEEVLTVNQKMSAQLGEKSVLAEQLHPQTITDLKPAISLNDKLLFIKELFNGYSLAYSEAIEILNRFTSFNEADLFLKKNYADKNNWNDKAETSGKFYALLKRRYA